MQQHAGGYRIEGENPMENGKPAALSRLSGLSTAGCFNYRQKFIGI